MTDTTIQIRPFQPADRAAIVAFRNARRPPHHRDTVTEWEESDALKPAGEVSLRLCVGDPATAYLNAVDRETAAHRKAGTCSFGLAIGDDPEWATVGGALYDRMEAWARERGRTHLESYVQLFTPDEPAAQFLAARGFAEIDRDVPVMLDLTTYDPTAFTPPVLDGLRLLSWAEAGDTPAHRRKLHALMCVLDRDVPTHGIRPEDVPFAEFEKDFTRPAWDSNALLLAETGAGEWVGLSQIGFQQGTGIGWTFLTGVLPAYRGRGLAYALKLRTLDAALARHCPLVLTENHEDNAPMRAINQKLGFVPDAPGIRYGKEMEAKQ